MRRERLRKGFAIFLFALLLVPLGYPTGIIPETLPVDQPHVAAAGSSPGVCTGFNYERSTWGAEWGFCPAHHVAFGVDDPAGPEGPAAIIRPVMSCCPLPGKDILLDDHVFAIEECPENYVATGSMTSGQEPNHVVHMRCTKINTSRYQLGEVNPGRYWGDGAAGWQGSRRINWDNIPAAIRFAQGRKSATDWDVDGCIGYPWGSMLTKKSSKYCAGFGFRQLQFKGANGDPAAGTAVQTYADCDQMLNVNDPYNVQCLKDSKLAKM